MMKKPSIAASLVAILSSMLALGCCLPLAFLGAAGAAGAAAFLAALRPWLLALSAVLLSGGFYQVYTGVRCGVRQSRTSMILLGLATALVLMVIVVPQFVAGFLANHLGRASR